MGRTAAHYSKQRINQSGSMNGGLESPIFPDTSQFSQMAANAASLCRKRPLLPALNFSVAGLAYVALPAQCPALRSPTPSTYCLN
jgi:hypothetical protein